MDDSQNPQPESAPPQKKRKGGPNVPISVAVGVICLGLGVAGGVVLANALYEPGKTTAPDEGQAQMPPPGKSGQAMPGGKGGGGMPGGGKGGGKGGGFGGGGPGGGGGGFGAPSSKMQLTQLVTKLDQLIGKPLVVELTDAQKKEANQLLVGLAEKDNLSEDEAKEKLDALLKLLEGQKDTLTAAGYRWPGTPLGGGGGGPPGGMQAPNPFKTGDPADRLKSLQTTLGK